MSNRNPSLEIRISSELMEILAAYFSRRAWAEVHLSHVMPRQYLEYMLTTRSSYGMRKFVAIIGVEGVFWLLFDCNEADILQDLSWTVYFNRWNASTEPTYSNSLCGNPKTIVKSASVSKKMPTIWCFIYSVRKTSTSHLYGTLRHTKKWLDKPNLIWRQLFSTKKIGYLNLI